MNSFLFFMLIIVPIAIAVMVFHRRYKLRKEEAEMREVALLQETVTAGTKKMRGKDYVAPPKSKANLHVVDKTPTKPVQTTQQTVDTQPTSYVPDDAWMFGVGMAAGSDTHHKAPDPEPQKFEGGGGTFDGAGASGDWDRSPSPSPDPEPSRYESPSSDSSYDSGSSSSSSYDSGSSSSDSSSSSSSDSSSSSSSSD